MIVWVRVRVKVRVRVRVRFRVRVSVMLRACKDAKYFKIKSCLRKTTTVLVLNTRLYEALSLFHFERTIFCTVNLIVSDLFMMNIFTRSEVALLV